MLTRTRYPSARALPMLQRRRKDVVVALAYRLPKSFTGPWAPIRSRACDLLPA
ncbi:hypothetical protein CBM2634_U640001 [Cupriavidus taiwanensis]|uniref:Uncharacterized protein n=1 Tax=Cupriavidus taiwanensis TaxID=164546 RepID=A0A375JFY1_9BURK|nr:hypothetical protein CBM2634_U640001 [Cupriavidus taiwanensis]